MFDSEPGRFRAWRARRRQKRENSQLRTWIAWIFVVVVLGGGILVVLLPKDWFMASSTSQEQIVPVDPHTVKDLAPTCLPQEPTAPDSETLVKAPQTSWVLLGKTAAPESDDLGPYVKNDFRQCFSRTPNGALYSAANYFAVLMKSSAAERVELFKTRVARDGDYPARLQFMQDIAVTDPLAELPEQRIVGYRWVSYTPDVATLQMVYMTPLGDMYSIVYNLLWQGNDWLMQAAPLTGPDTQEVESLVNYIPWSGTT